MSKSITFSYVIYLTIAILLIPQPGLAGKLDDFERDLEKEETRSHDENEDPFGSCIGDAVGSCLGELFGALFNAMIADGVSTSNERARHPSTEYRIEEEDHEKVNSHEFEGRQTKEAIFPRKGGDPLLPLVRLDVSYQNVESDVSAFEWRTEIGYGPVGFQVKQTYYEENDPSDELRITQLHALLRMSFSNSVEVDLGLGALMIDDHKGRVSFTSPILIYPQKYIGLEFRPTFNEYSLNDYDLGVSFSLPYVALRMGYRWVESVNESLNGPYAGLSFRY